jgi:glycosyltransferase involved in cell wall biosynthesis
MTKNPTFSIIITCHNYERYVGNAIRSALAQSTSSIEVIAVDAGSTDHSSDIIRSFDNIHYVHAPKGSHALACEAGFLSSKNEVIIFLDADDLLHPEACSHLASLWREDTVKTQFNLDVINAEGRQLGRTSVTFPKNYSRSTIRDSFERSGTYIWPTTSGNAYSKKFLQKMMPFAATLPPDGQWNTVAPCFGEVDCITSSLGSYRLHDSNIDSHDLHPGDFRRFQKNIKRRYRELFHARTLARKNNLIFPKKNILNAEFPFLSYRLFLLQAGETYIGYRNDSKVILMTYLLRYLFRNRSSFSFFIKVMLWHSILLLLPRSFVEPYVKKRFARGLS